MSWINTPLLDYRIVKHSEGQILLGFGKKKLTFSELGDKVDSITGSNCQLIELEQTHSNKIICSDICPGSDGMINTMSKADGHYSLEKGLCLIVKTADCLPVLFFSKTHPFIAAVHAGWRGVENGILLNLIEKFQTLSYPVSDLHSFIGPHIQQKSFEVDSDVAALLVAAYKSSINETHPPSQNPLERVIVQHHSSKKSHINLTAIAQQQLYSKGMRPDRLEEFQSGQEAPDTKTDLEYASYRRDQQDAGRCLSFIVRF